MARTTPSDPSGYHDWHSPEYVESWIAADVLHDDERRPILRRVADGLPIDRDRATRVLDVGGGYGMLSREVLASAPLATVVLLDLSAAMLSEARERLADLEGRVEFVQADIRDPGWTGSVQGGFDAVVSSMAIHNVRHASQIRQIYKDIYTIVRAGGCFVNIDLVPPAGPGAAGFLPTRGRRTSDAGDLFAQLGWLRTAGFAEVDCIRRDSWEATLVAVK
jgi:ubiquinone/menaquinone biosynthesis C-methylase UbiE